MFNEDYGDLISIKELCELLSIGKSTAYKLLSENELHAFRIGKNWKIPRAAVTEYVIRQSKLPVK